MRALVIQSVVVTALLSGCGGSSATSLVVVSVDCDAPLADVATLHARVTIADQSREFDVHPSSGGTVSIPPAQTFGISLPRTLTGELGVHVEAHDVDANTVATGDGSGSVRVGGRADIAVKLVGAITDADMTQPASADMATAPADMAQTGDMVVIPPAMLTLDKTMQSFGDITVGKTSTTASFLIVNAGGMDSGLPMLTTGGANLSEFTIDTDCGASLKPGARCHVTASVAPTSPGMKQATFTLKATPGGELSGTVTANALTPGAVKITQPSGDCGSAVIGVQSATTAKFTVQNTGASATGVLSVMTSDPQFTATGCSGSALAAGGTCTVTVTFKPSTSGTQNASLSVSASPGGTDTASLVGVGLKPASLRLAPAMYTFASTAVGATGDTGVFTVSNDGDVAAPALTAATINGANPTSFAITTDKCKTVALDGNSSCMISVQFKPQFTGTNNAALNIATGTMMVGSAALTGMGLTPAALKVSPMMATFTKRGTVTFTVTNDGQVASGALAAAAIGGANSSSFTVTADSCSGSPLGPSPASCSVTVKSTPTATGTQNATLSLSATPGGSASAALTSPGLNPASLRVAPDHYVFGTSPRASTGEVTTFNVYNDGEVASASLSQSTITGTNASSFTITSDGCKNTSIGPSPASCAIQVQFTPQISGTNSGTLNIGTASSTIASPALSGTATAVWTQEATNLALVGHGVNAVWASDANHVWAVGDDGVVATRDATGLWTLTSLTPSFVSVWGSGPTNVYAGSYQRLYNSTGPGSWTDLGTEHVGQVFGFSNADVFVATGALVWHLTPSAGWTSEAVAGANGLWGTSDTDLFGYGSVRTCDPPPCTSFGVILHRDATGWTRQAGSSGPLFTGMWGFGAPATNIYATQSNLRPVHSTGNGAWDLLAPPAPSNCTAVWGADPTHLFFACGGIYQFDGTNWTGPDLAGTDLRGLFGTAANNVYAVGLGAIYHYY